MLFSGIWELKTIALRNLARHKVKTLLTAAAVMISVAVYIFINSFVGGMATESRRNIVNYDMSAAKLQTRMYFEKKDERPSYENFTGWEKYSDALDRAGFNSAPRYVFSGMMFANAASAPMTFNAVDPASEAKVLHYADYIDFGRYPQSGKLEVAVGTVAAEKLRVGIPTRPRKLQLEELIGQAAKSADDSAFIRSLYGEAKVLKGIFASKERMIEGNERVILKRGASRADLDRLWGLIAATDRNDVRVSAVIDIKAVPEVIKPDKWDGELMPELREEDRALVKAAYQYEDFVGGYLLTETDEERQGIVLEAMVRAGFQGAIRHVNQLIDAVVVGVINCPDPMPNGNVAYIPLDALQDESGMMLEGAVTELLIREKGQPISRLPGVSESKAAITAAMEKSLGAKLPDDLAVFFWLDYMADYLGYEALQTSVPQIIVGLLLLLSFLGISNTVLLAILERTKEIGMMRALGMTDRQMVIVYMLEAGFLGFIGACMGMILGALVVHPMVKYGLDFGAMGDAMGGAIGFRVKATLRSSWNVPLIFITGAAATIIAALMAYFPTKRALRMEITDSLRFE